jgi:hypothetical protein
MAERLRRSIHRPKDYLVVVVCSLMSLMDYQVRNIDGVRPFCPLSPTLAGGSDLPCARLGTYQEDGEELDSALSRGTGS